MSNPLPLNGPGVIRAVESALTAGGYTRRQSAVKALHDAYGTDSEDDVPDGTNGTTKSYNPPVRAVDPSQGHGNRQGPKTDPLLRALQSLASVGR